MKVLIVIATLISTFLIVYSGILFITSSGNPEKTIKAKHVLRNAIVGLVIVIGAFSLTNILNQFYVQPSKTNQNNLPVITEIKPADTNNGLIETIIDAINGLITNIVTALAKPFMSALDYFTSSTPLMSENQTVFNLWLTTAALADALFVIVLALIGFHVIGGEVLSFQSIDLRHLLPKIVLTFLLINSSIFVIDELIRLSNAMISAVNITNGQSSVWQILLSSVNVTNGQCIAVMILVLILMILTVVLLIYYVGRLVGLFIGAVLSPLGILLSLVPGFKEFSVAFLKTYLITIFILFVHVIILKLAASLFTGLTSSNNPLMSAITGIAVIISLLKTQGLMFQLSCLNRGVYSIKNLGYQFVNGISYLKSRSEKPNSDHQNRYQQTGFSFSSSQASPAKYSRSQPSLKSNRYNTKPVNQEPSNYPVKRSDSDNNYQKDKYHKGVEGINYENRHHTSSNHHC